MRTRTRRARWEMAATLPGFDPRMVPEVAAGYFWLASQASGLGTAAFKVPEGGAHSTFDFVQATVASQPTQLTENSGAQFRLRKSGDANPTILKTSGDVTAGWTGATYIAGWWRLPDASGAVTGTGTFFGHRKSGTARVNHGVVSTSGGRHSVNVSTDGTTVVNHQYATSMAGAAWTWLELLFNPALSTPDTLKFFAGFGELTRAVTGTIPSSLADVSAPITIGFSSVTSLSNADTTDWAAAYYCNGIPSLFNRQRLMAHQAPIATGFA